MRRKFIGSFTLVVKLYVILYKSLIYRKKWIKEKTNYPEKGKPFYEKENPGC
jgi:hypothetical protein